MSRNIICTIGHHTFKYEPPKYTEVGVPFCSEAIEESNSKGAKYKFLGKGYYFWDDNIDQAHNWGMSHYKGQYKIWECPMKLQGENFLDLIGCREDIRMFVNILKKLSSKRGKKMLVGESLYYLQLMAKYQPECFPFTIIRSIDVTKGETINYTSQNRSQLLLNPQIIICFYKKNEIPLQNARVL